MRKLFKPPLTLIKVISLSRSLDRRKHIESHFSNKGLKFSFFDAIDANETDIDLDSYFSKKLFEKKELRHAEPAEVCIKVSQYLVIEDFILNSFEEILIVFEDDAKVLCSANHLESLMAEFNNSIYDILVLGYSKCDDLYEKHANIINPVFITNKCEWGIGFGPRHLSSYSGAVGLAIKRQAAAKFLSITPQFTLADDWAYFVQAGFKVAYTSPMIVREELIELLSTANHENKSSKPYQTNSKIINFIILIRKYILGYSRLTALYLINLLTTKY
jgi:GR25 family glycosyltransferase involved in LPS biosynthesis